MRISVHFFVVWRVLGRLEALGCFYLLLLEESTGGTWLF